MMKCFYTLILLFVGCLFSRAQLLTTEYVIATKGSQVKSSIQADTYYILSGIDQNSREYYLFDNGGQVKGSSSFPSDDLSTGTHIWSLKASGSEWIICNVGTGKKMVLGGNNGSAIRTSTTEQSNSIHFSSDGYMTILNSNGQAIDMTQNGANPTTWRGTTTPTGSRRLKIYAVENVEVKTHKSLGLVPAPKSHTLGEGEYVLEKGFTIGVKRFSDSEVQNQVLADVARCMTTMNKATGLACEATSGKADITISEDTDIAPEGYVLDITKEGVTIKVSSADGVFYAMQSLMRLLPPNVVLGKPSEEGVQYTLPVVRIDDEPRFGYRGFMLDVSRHFFTVDQIKKMLDLMAIYKMNVFHWHLTDDQGWRAEIKQYPKLTTVGAQRRSSNDTPISKVEENGQIYWTGELGQTNKQYGPFFYTQEEMRDVVRYAAERHIDILPEVDMPGHFVAAMHAYPEYSCNPNNPPQVWITGGISPNVLNVANPEAVQFAKNIVSELCEIFPYPYFHIGGDECPTGQWENNALCQEKLKKLGKTSFRALQTDFIREMGEHLATFGKKLFCWNESITDAGADLDLMKKSGATIMCWTPCQAAADKAASMGLNAIITEYGSGCYYINRKQSNDYGEPSAAGGGGDHVAATYNYVPVPSSVSADKAMYYIGVQATFWTEFVSSDEYLEYLALPRLMCIAESGWTPQELKNWNSFVDRMTQETKMLDLGEYIYARHWMDDYIPRQAPASVFRDGSVVTFTNKSADRGRCLQDEGGTLNGQGKNCTEWTLEAASSEGKFYIRSNVSGKYLYAANGNANTLVELSNSKTEWTFDTTTFPGFVAICYNSTSGQAVNNNASNATKARLAAHGTGNGSSFWAIEGPEEDTSLKEGEKGLLTYIFNYRGLGVERVEFKLEAGTAYPSIADYVPNGYVATESSPSGTVRLKNETLQIPVDKVPEDGCYYRFYNGTMKKYVSTDDATFQTFRKDVADESTIFYYHNSSILAYDRGLYLQGAELVAADQPTTSMVILPSLQGEVDMYNIIGNGEDYLRFHTQDTMPNSVTRKDVAQDIKACNFATRDVLALPVEIGEGGWTTFSAPVSVTVPQGCMAYVTDNYNASTASLSLTGITPGTTIAANTGIMVKGTPSSIIEFTISETGCSFANNFLQASVPSTLIPEDETAYTLVYNNGVISFQKMDENNRIMPSHSSWLNIDDSAQPNSISIVLPEQETGIEDIESVETSIKNIYNVQGQSLLKPQPGVNIINGKKVVVK